MKSNLNKIFNGDSKELTKRDITKNYNRYGYVEIRELPKDSIIIIDGDSIEIVKKDKTVYVDGDLNITSEGTITVKANEVIIQTTDGALWKPNTMTIDLYTGAPHSILQSISGENK